MSQHEMKVGEAHFFLKKSTNFHIYRYIRFAIVTFKCYRNVEVSFTNILVYHIIIIYLLFTISILHRDVQHTKHM